ncbi:MAG: hypothetical protein WCC36_18530 [Gammaproteobacteria bacterium]
MNRPIVGNERRSVRFSMLLEPAEVEELDDFRYRMRIPSRAEAVRYLIKRGLQNCAADSGVQKHDPE